MPGNESQDGGQLRPYIIGGVSSLALSVVGGVLVYFFTVAQEPKAVEQLVYQIPPAASFATDARQVRIQSITLENRGRVPARDVRFVIRLPGTPKVLGKDITFSAGAAVEFREDTVVQSGTSLKLPVLAPGEKIIVSYLLEGGASQPPDVSAKSSASVAVRLVEAASEDRREVPRITQIITLVTALLFQIFLLWYLKRYLRRIRRRSVGVYSVEPNNVGFVLLHQGFVKEAIEVFETAIRAGNADSYLFSNYAVAQCISQESDKALRLLAAADFWAKSDQQKAQVEFCRALIMFSLSGATNEAERNLQTALQHDPSVRGYLEFSSIVANLKQSSNEIATAIQRASAVAVK